MLLLNIKIVFDSKEDANIFFKSIKPELQDFLRSKILISLKKEIMFVKITASDKVALRASLNSISKPLLLFSNLKKIS